MLRPPLTVPAPLPLHTEARAAEHGRYDNARVAHEAELEAQRAEQRRLQVLAEGRQCTSSALRYRANEVRRWYAHAPKRPRDTTT